MAFPANNFYTYFNLTRIWSPTAGQDFVQSRDQLCKKGS